MSFAAVEFDHERLEVHQVSLDLVEAVDRFRAALHGHPSAPRVADAPSGFTGSIRSSARP